jgi:hypothetical protein
MLRLLVTANIVPRSPIFFTLMMETMRSSKKHRFLQEPHGVTFNKMEIFSHNKGLFSKKVQHYKINFMENG